MGKATILVVEDDRIIAEDIRISLLESGYSVGGLFATGEEAVARCREEKPDLVLMDIMLAGKMDGIEAARKIYGELRVPVVYLTSNTDAKILQRAKETEPFGYLVKPYDDNGLDITIDMALYKHKMEEERQRLTSELRAALEKIKTLEGLIPICAWCKKIRDDEGYWGQLEEYFARHSSAVFSHGMCPDCYDEMRQKNKKARP